MAKIKSEIMDEDDNEIRVACYYDESASPQISENDLKFNVAEIKTTKESINCLPAISISNKERGKSESVSNQNQSGNVYECGETKTLNKTKTEKNDKLKMLKKCAEEEEERRQFISCMPVLKSMDLSEHQQDSNSKNFYQNIEWKPSIEEGENFIGFEYKKKENKRVFAITSATTSTESLSSCESLNRNTTEINKVNRGFKKKEYEPSAKHKTDIDGNDQFLGCTSATTSKKLLKSKSRKSDKCKEGGNVNQYIKTKVLKEMLEKGCSSDVFNEIIRNFKASPTKIKETLNVNVKEAQDFVFQECDSLSFQNIKAWLEYFQATNTNEHCSYELAIIMNAIGHNELHPQPDSLDGINLKALYGFLSNALMGLPQPPLDNKSREFLIQEFENIVNEANTEMGDLDTMNMRIQLLANRDLIPDTTSSLNPLKLNNNLDNI